MNKIIRKNKSILVNNGNEENKLNVTISIESNHINNNLDDYLTLLNSNVKNIMNYSVINQVKPVKETKEEKAIKKKKKAFSQQSHV